jgi:hypothetical protein
MLAPASAKKKKKFVPITFEASGSFAIGNPADLDGAGITRNEFAATCAIPATQGVDGYAIELSEEISKVPAQVGVTGSDAGAGHDLDMYFYDESCGSTGSASTEAADEIGVFPAGTKWVVVTAFFGVELEFDLVATEIKL